MRTQVSQVAALALARTISLRLGPRLARFRLAYALHARSACEARRLVLVHLASVGGVEEIRETACISGESALRYATPALEDGLAASSPIDPELRRATMRT
jgi:hypothetical protein